MTASSLLKSRQFAPLFWTQFFGALNDNLLKNALLLMITFRSAQVFGLPPAQMVPIAGGIFILPYLLFSAIAGQLADQSEKSLLVRWIKLIEIAIMGIAIAGFVFHQFELLLLVLFLMGTHSTFFGPIKFSLLPQHLPTEQLAQANALVEAGTFLAIILGALGAGLLVASPHSEFTVSIAIFTVAVAGWHTSRSIPLAPATDSPHALDWTLIRPTLQIIRTARETPTVYQSILSISWFWLFGAAVLSLIPTLAKETLHGTPELATWFLGIFSVGIGLGSMICGGMARSSVASKLSTLGLLGITLFTGLLAWTCDPSAFQKHAPGSLGLLDFLASLSGFRITLTLLGLSLTSGIYIVPLYTLMQKDSPIEVRSRVIGANNILNALWMIGGAILLSVLSAALISVPMTFFILAALNLILGLPLMPKDLATRSK